MTRAEAELNAKPGWKLSPNQSRVEGIIRGINRCNGECPCVNSSYDRHCPCSNYRVFDKCCCGLYVKEEER